MANEKVASEETPAQKKHSRLGIASFVISLLMGLYESALVVVGFILKLQSVTEAEDSIVLVIYSIFIVAGLIISLIGVFISIAGMIQGKRKRLFAALGFFLNLLVIAVFFVVHSLLYDYIAYGNF